MKKVLYLFIPIMCLISICGCSSDAEVSGISAGQTEAESLTGAEKKYSIGDEIFIKNEEGEYKIIFTGIKETKKRNQFSDKQAKRVVIVSYEYENISKNSDLYISNMNCRLYDKQNNSMEIYPINVKSPQPVSRGRKSSGEIAYALNSPGNYVEVEFYDNIFNSKSDCKAVLEW